MSDFELTEDDFDIDASELELDGVAEAASPESVDDSVDAVIEELAKGAEDEADKPVQGDKGKKKSKPVDKEVSEAASKLAKSRKRGDKSKAVEVEGAGGEEAEAAEELEPLQPPTRWPVEKKEWFLRQPREVQEEAARGWADIESHTTRLWQDLNREKAQFEDVNRVVQHYLPQWNLRGMTPSQAVSELCAVQDVFSKQGAIAGCMTVLQKNGVTPEMLLDATSGGHTSTVPQQRPAGGGLTEAQVMQLIEQRTAQQMQQQAVVQAEAEFRAVQSELTADGRYAYPELHDVHFIDRAKPFVSDLRKTQPSISWGEAFKRVTQTLRTLDGRNVGSPSAVTSPKLPNDIERVKAASVSVRGRGNPNINTSAFAKKGESIEDSARAVLEELNSL